MKKYFLSFSAVVIAVLLVAFTQPKAESFDTRHFRYSEDDISFANLADPAKWTPVTLPATGCDNGSIPCIVRVENLTDYGGSYSPGVIDEVDFARYLELQGSSAAQSYVTGDDMVESKE